MSEPAVCFIDIETSPILGYTWGTYDTNVLSVVEPTKVICCSWKWLGDATILISSLPDYPDYVPGRIDDASLVKTIWDVLDQADVVIAHNGDSFDIKILNARFLAHGLKPPSDYKTIDTLKAAKKYFRFGNNSLNELGDYLDEGRKAPTGGLETWLKCIDGDLKAWEVMANYNAKDIELLERVYLRLRPFIGNHPDLNMFSSMKVDGFPCGSCQSTDTIKRGFAMTKAGRYQRYQCQSCGSWSSGPYEKVHRNVDGP